jgi:acyl transferase domain-containing protein
VVTGPTPWEGGLVGLSSFGFGGSNVHCLVAGRVRQRGEGTLPLQVGKPNLVGETIIEEVQEAEAIKIAPEVRSHEL